MSASKYVKLSGSHTHPELLSNGQTVVPGEPFERKLLDKDGDARLVEEGLIIDSAAPGEED